MNDHFKGVEAATGRPRAPHSLPLSVESTRTWVIKAQHESNSLLTAAPSVANRSEVAAVRVDDSSEWLFGRFMLAWLDPTPQIRGIKHLPDAGFFLRLLEKAYGPVVDADPAMAELLTDTSRPEMSITNDVLQIQLRGLELGNGYSMIRQHALMLFHAALWLEEPRRSQWLDLYDRLVSYADSLPGGRPGLQQLADLETRAFDDFIEFSAQTLDERDADALLQDDHALRSILDYQLYAAVAIGLLWREYRALPVDKRQAWQHDQLSVQYLRRDYLESEWIDHS